MDWALNDSEHGAYSKGKLQIGIEGDFATSASLGNDFASLLAVQVADWFRQLRLCFGDSQLLSLVEIGPGEGDLVFDLISALQEDFSWLIPKMEVILVESSPCFRERQKNRLETLSNVSISWMTFDQLAKKPIIGIMIANEMLDALPVDRFIWHDQKLWREGVELSCTNDKYFLNLSKLTIPVELQKSINEVCSSIGLQFPPDNVHQNWSSEWHSKLKEWFAKASASMIAGPMLIIDYMLPFNSYYKASRPSGTIIAYKGNIASDNVLLDPGNWDITSHLCKEIVAFWAEQNGWLPLGSIKQGQALLALGLSERLHTLQLLPSSEIAKALNSREALLRLVDPLALGEFQWMAFETNSSKSRLGLSSLFLEEPIK